MSYMVTRKEDDRPAGRRHIMIDHPPADSPDAGFGMGGSFYFEPGETIVMPEYSALVIMNDPGLRKMFTVDPPLPEDKLVKFPEDEESPADGATGATDETVQAIVDAHPVTVDNSPDAFDATPLPAHQQGPMTPPLPQVPPPPLAQPSDTPAARPRAKKDSQ